MILVGEDVKVDNSEKLLVAETPFLKKATHTEVLEIPDGGSILVPVHYRPASVRAENRRWVLRITPRIVIEEEEREIRRAKLPVKPR